MNVIWFKRDLRLFDSESVYRALQSDNKILLLYIFEPSLIKDYHYSQRHFDFIKQSLENINQTLKLQNAQILVVKEEVLSVFTKLNFEIKSVGTFPSWAISTAGIKTFFAPASAAT